MYQMKQSSVNENIWFNYFDFSLWVQSLFYINIFFFMKHLTVWLICMIAMNGWYVVIWCGKLIYWSNIQYSTQYYTGIWHITTDEKCI